MANASEQPPPMAPPATKPKPLGRKKKPASTKENAANASEQPPPMAPPATQRKPLGRKKKPASTTPSVQKKSAGKKAAGKAAREAREATKIPQAAEPKKPDSLALEDIPDEDLIKNLKTQGDEYLDQFSHEEILNRINSIVSGYKVTGRRRDGVVKKLRFALRLVSM